MASEFDLISRYFDHPTPQADLGVGDDAALFTPRAGHQLVVSCDMLVSGTHFFPDASPRELGWKTLAVNVSDLAAMGARPRWATLALALPDAREDWIRDFAEGFLECAARFSIDLVGGDTTRGPLNLCPTLFGEVPRGQAVTRGGARPGDDIWVSGAPGRAALGLWQLQGKCTLDAARADDCLEALHRPEPRLWLGLNLRGLASAMLDISDGLLGDLGHILERSGVGAELHEAHLPLEALTATCGSHSLAQQALLAGGDDYELLFTAPQRERAHLQALSDQLDLPLHRIGLIHDRNGSITLVDQRGHSRVVRARGFDHFAAATMNG